MELRRQSEVAEQDGSADGDGSPVTKKQTSTATATRRTRRTTKKKTPQRTRARWGVFNGSMQRVALFDYAERSAADAKANELSNTSKGHHFVQVVKEPITDSDD